jgi:hypothetical protein
MASLANQDAPDQVVITELKWAGSGCPPGSPVTSSVVRNRKALSLVFSSLDASAGPGVPITENRENCNLILRLSVPQGWSFTLFSADYRGFANLDRLVQATLRSAYFFEGEFPSSALEAHLVGPIDKKYRIRDTLDLDEVGWSPCGEDRALNVNTEVRVNNRSNRRGSGLIELNKTLLGIKWRRC